MFTIQRRLQDAALRVQMHLWGSLLRKPAHWTMGTKRRDPNLVTMSWTTQKRSGHAGYAVCANSPILDLAALQKCTVPKRHSEGTIQPLPLCSFAARWSLLEVVQNAVLLVPSISLLLLRARFPSSYGPTPHQDRQNPNSGRDVQ